MAKIRRTIFLNCIGDADKLRALSMHLFCLKNLNSAGIKHFTINKLHDITGLHATTCKKYINILFDMKLVEIIGNNHTLSFKSLKGRHDRRNIFLDDLVDYSTVKQIEYSLEALAITLIILHKLYAKQVIETAYHGHRLADVKAARRTCRNRGYGREFVDNGLSFKTIAKRINVSVQKAFFVTLFGEKFGFFRRIKNQIQVYRRDAALAFAYSGENFTFHTKNNLYKVGANRYELSEQVLAALGMVIN